eukprot:m.91826 g.91826  ORF g.91826 m.91826 type:complete len:62 (+) comp14646_c0_seq2:1239-1424(+)
MSGSVRMLGTSPPPSLRQLRLLQLPCLLCTLVIEMKKKQQTHTSLNEESTTCKEENKTSKR